MRKISLAKVPLLGLEPAGDGLPLAAVSGAEKLAVSL